MIYDCAKLTNCSSCSGTLFPCAWCLNDGVCHHKDEPCPTQGPVAISSSVLPNDSELFAKSGQDTAYNAISCPSIDYKKSEYLVASGQKVSMEVGAKNFDLWMDESGQHFYPPMSCIFDSPHEDEHITSPATVNALDPENGHYLVTCEEVELSYLKDNGMVEFQFDVKLDSSAQPLGNPNNIYVTVYKCSAMVSHCGTCLTMDEKFNCGWCQTVCAFQDECPSWLDRDAICPDPRILRFDPSSGPINGGTKITVNGINLGSTIEQLKGAITVADYPCIVQEEGYVPSSTFVCETQSAEGAAEGPLSVTVADTYTTMSTFRYVYTSPEFVELTPSKGLVTGFNRLSLIGHHMDLGNKAVVYIAGIECNVRRRNETHMSFRSPEVDEPGPVSLRVVIDGTEYALDLSFTYITNPTIYKLHPPSAIVSGGNIINVTGSNFDGVQKAVISMLATANDIHLPCTIPSDDTLQCQTRSLTEYNLEGIEFGSLPFHYDIVLDKLQLTPDTLALQMDYKPIMLYADPIIEAIDTDGHIMDYEEGMLIILKGENIVNFRPFPDWEVYVGGILAPRARVGNMNKTLEVVPPEEVDYLVEEGLAEIRVVLGNFVAYPGYVRYPQEGDSNIALILGLTFGLVIPVVLAILLIVICLRRQSLKHRTNRRALITGDTRGNYQPASMLPPPSEMQALDNDEEKGLLPTDTPAVIEEETPVDVVGDNNPDYVQRLLNKLDNKKLRAAVAEVVISRERLELDHVLGHGHFGSVYLARLKDENMSTYVQVAVKTLQGDDFPPHMVSSFLEEGVVMKKFDHPHVLRLLGVGVGENDEPMVVIPWMANGDLRMNVRKKKKVPTATLR